MADLTGVGHAGVDKRADCHYQSDCRSGKVNFMTEQSSQKRMGPFLFYAIVLVLAYLSFRVIEPFLVALCWAVVLVVVFYPAYVWLTRRMGRTLASLVATLGVTLILIVPTLMVMGAFVRQGVDAGRLIQEGIANGRFNWINHAWQDMASRFSQSSPVDLATLLHRYADQSAAYLAAKLGLILRNLAIFLFHLSVTLFAMFYLFRDGDALVARVREVLPFEISHREHMIRETRDLIFASVSSSLAAAVMHGILGGLAFAVLGISAPIFWGVMMGFFSLVPLVGSALIWAPASLSLIISGHLWHGIILAIVCGGIVGLVDNFLRPWLISGRAEMGGLVVFISVLGGISVFGLLGVILGPIVVAAMASLLELYAPTDASGNADAKRSAKKRPAVLE
ncbi:MAG: AI-2E family transporter [Candidatus Acidiferrales bacterium]